MLPFLSCNLELMLDRSPLPHSPLRSPSAQPRASCSPGSRSVLPAFCLCSISLPPHWPILPGLSPALLQPRDGLAVQSTGLVFPGTHLEPDCYHGQLDPGKDQGGKPALILASRGSGWGWGDYRGSRPPGCTRLGTVQPCSQAGAERGVCKGGLRLKQLENLL